MTGSLIQLVANSDSVENCWLEGNPQITFFKTLFRRHTPFASEFISIPLKKLNFGTSETIKLPPKGDLVYRMFVSFTLPEIYAEFTKSKSHTCVDLIKCNKFNNELLNKKMYECINIFGDIDYDAFITLINTFEEKFNTE